MTDRCHLNNMNRRCVDFSYREMSERCWCSGMLMLNPARLSALTHLYYEKQSSPFFLLIGQD